MYDRHWTDDELVARLYGVKPEDTHIRTCASCARRWDAIRSRYDNLHTDSIDVSEAFLLSQRRAIEARLGQKRIHAGRTLVPIAAALALAAVLFVTRPAPEKPKVVNELSDSQLIEDVFTRASATEPSSVGPIRSLFEEQK